MAEEASEAAALQKQLAAQERELARQAAQLAKDAAEAEVRGREASKQLSQAEASQVAMERRAEELNAAELRVRELQVGGSVEVQLTVPAMGHEMQHCMAWSHLAVVQVWGLVASHGGSCIAC